MSSAARNLLQHALPLVRSHGFTRETLSLAALSLPNPHPKPLSDTAVSTLFGAGDDARRTLICAWLDEGKKEMGDAVGATVESALKTRLRWNIPVLNHLPEAFAVLASPTDGIPPLDPRPLISHCTGIADQACRLVQDKSVGTDWYTRRASLAMIYSAAELHQLTSPDTAEGFLDEMLDMSGVLGASFDDAGQYIQYITRSWMGIINSSGVR